ncbi:hypothetical protein L1G94_000517 [Escherichia coli]|nr:hypothetical protein [Escherichia coli]
MELVICLVGFIATMVVAQKKTSEYAPGILWCADLLACCIDLRTVR